MSSERSQVPTGREGSPPSYATAIPSPDYSQAPLPSEHVVESSFNPPPYLHRVTTSSTHRSSLSSTTSWHPDSLYEQLISSSASYSGSSSSNVRPLTTVSSSSSSTSIGGRPPSCLLSLAEPFATEPSEQRFVYRSGSIELDLGSRPLPDQTNPTPSAIPSFGLGATIRGEVRLKKLNHVQGVIVNLEGRLQNTIMQAGLAAGHSAANVIDLSKVIYTAPNSSDGDKMKNRGGAAFPFELTFPEFASNGVDRLPPTFRGVHPAVEGWIKYTVKVQVVKSGFWPRETLSTVVHYLPKSYLRSEESLLWPAISLMDAKRFGLECNANWRTTKAKLLYDPFSSKGTPGSSSPELSLSLTRTAQAVANYCFPFNVTLRLPSYTSSELDAFVNDPKRLNLQLLRATTMTINGQKSSQIISLGRARYQQVEKELVRGCDERIIRGGFKVGTNQGEASWRFGDLVENRYFVRVTVSLDDKQPPIFKHDEPIEMFTHSREQFEDPFEAQDAPAYNLLLASSLGNNRLR